MVGYHVASDDSEQNQLVKCASSRTIATGAHCLGPRRA
jgi:hypothetical protein